MDSDKDITAIFLDGYDLTTSVQGQGAVTPSSGLYLPGTLVELTATPAGNYTLDYWVVNGTTHANSGPVTTLVMDDDKNVTAVLTWVMPCPPRFLPERPVPSNSTRIIPAARSRDTRTGSKGRHRGRTDRRGRNGLHFDYWEESGVQHRSGPQCSVTMDSDRSVSVAFAEGTTITTFVSPDETAGRIEYNPDLPGVRTANVRTETYRPGTSLADCRSPRRLLLDHWEMNGQTIGTDPFTPCS